MSRIEIPVNGISTTTTYNEGDCTELVNLRKKNGALHPVSPRKTVREFSNSYTLLFVHRNESYEHLIGVRAGKLYWITRENLTDVETLIMEVAGSVSITQTGNILNILTSDGIKYAMWRNNEYIHVNHNISIDIDIFSDVKKREGSPETFVFTGSGIPIEGDELRNETAKALYAKQKRILNDKGLLTGYVLAVAAVEMFDGNIIYVTNPVLLAQTGDKYKRYSNLTVSKDANTSYTYDYQNNPTLFNDFKGESSLQEPEWIADNYRSYTTTDIHYHAGIPDSIPLSGPQTDGIPITMINGSTVNNGDITSSDILPHVCATGDELFIKITSTLDASLSNLVKSISVYITPEVSLYDFTHIGTVKKGYFTTDTNFSLFIINTSPVLKTAKQLRDELMSQANFYKVQEITLAEANSSVGQTIQVDLKGKLGDNLLTREALPVDTVRHTIKAVNQIVYNSRLHLLDYSTTLFCGYPLSNFKAIPGGGHFPIVNTWENFSWWMEVTIVLSTGISKVVSSKFNTAISDLNPLLSYPDARATSIKLYISGSTTENIEGIGPVISYHKYEKEFTLTKHQYHNFAYYISPDFKPIPIEAAFTSVAYTPPVLNEVNVTEVFHNGIKVSATNNPLYFPPEHSYQVGSGTILNAATNAMNVSDRNFGMYPLFVATTQGWFMMNIGSGETAYSSITPITSSDVPLNTILCSIPYGVIFIAKRGLYLINSNGTELITPQIEEIMPALNIQGHDAIMQLSGSNYTNYDNVADNGFRDFLTRVKALIYDFGENELIIVSSTASESNWVLNFDSKMMYRSTEAIDYQVQNTYPQLLAMVGTKQKDYSQEETADTAVSLLLRPVACGTRDIKKLERVLMRALLRSLKNKDANTNSVIVVWHSDDAVNFSITRGMNILPDNYRDYDFGLFARTKNRWFTFGFRGIISSESTINSFDVVINKEYDNEKMR